jgi:hypothetical protein
VKRPDSHVARRWTDDDLLQAVVGARSVSDVCRSLGIVPCGGNDATVWRGIDRLGLDADHLRRRPRVDPLRPWIPALAQAGRLDDAVRTSRSIAEVCRKLGVDEVSSRRAVVAAMTERGLDASHLLGQAWRRGRIFGPRVRILDALAAGTVKSSSAIRERLIAEGVRDRRCELCGLESWRGGPIPLELDHIDGDRTNNRLENLRLVCPNCHAQTPTYRGRNIGRRGEIRQPRPT